MRYNVFYGFKEYNTYNKYENNVISEAVEFSENKTLNKYTL
jgi:hypothetical protein